MGGKKRERGIERCGGEDEGGGSASPWYMHHATPPLLTPSACSPPFFSFPAVRRRTKQNKIRAFRFPRAGKYWKLLVDFELRAADAAAPSGSSPDPDAAVR